MCHTLPKVAHFENGPHESKDDSIIAKLFIPILYREACHNILQYNSALYAAVVNLMLMCVDVYYHNTDDEK